jgi:class 3 adenylate cyclase
MGLKEDLEKAVDEIVRVHHWSTRKGQVVPEPDDLALKNDAVEIDATVLYADMADSTQLVDKQKTHLAAEVYKSYMACAARIIKNAGGTITAYDGDRVMGIFIGNQKNTTATKTALQINGAVDNIVNPALKKQYGVATYQMKHAIGIDTGPIFACRIGVRNDNDIVWVGRAANYAAKLANLNDSHPVFVTGAVFDAMNKSSKYGGNPETLMWEERSWTQMNKMRVHRSNWIWPL